MITKRMDKPNVTPALTSAPVVINKSDTRTLQNSNVTYTEVSRWHGKSKKRRKKNEMEANEVMNMRCILSFDFALKKCRNLIPWWH